MLFDLVEESKKLISIRSISSEGTREAVEHLAPFCRQLGFNLTLQAAGNGAGDRELNLIAHTVPEGAPDLCPQGLALVTHLDTVPPGDLSLWTETGGDPFRATIKGDRIYGLGSADTKLDFLCKLQAVETVGLKNIKIPTALIGTFGEERALAGTRLLHETGIVHPKFALIGEPSELQPVNAHKGILYLRGVWEPPHPASGHPLPYDRGEGRVRGRVFHGRAAHGSTPHLGENAIEKAVRWLIEEQKRRPFLQLVRIDGGTVHNIVPERCEIEAAQGDSECPRLLFLKKFFGLLAAAESYLRTHSNEFFDPPRTTRNVGVIRGDEKRIEIEFDFRLIPETDGNELYEIFQVLPREIPGARVEMIRSNPPMATDRGSEIARRVEEALKKVGLPASFAAKAGNTEGAIFNAIGAESIVIGPGKSTGNIHSPNEYNGIPELRKAVSFYEAFLRQFC
jgi:succinyl-diaminopimelate desuccinylase